MEQKEQVLSFRTIQKSGCGEITEKKSRFIATLCPTQTQEEAEVFIEQIKRKYRDARHHCFAYVIGRRAESVRCSDDGEPQGTAGRPMLELLCREKLCNVTAVVTRYFGGTLLGTGGLARAYTDALKEGLKVSKIVTMRCGIRLVITADYNDAGKIQVLLEKTEAASYEPVYTQEVTFFATLPIEKKEGLQKEIAKVTNAKAKIEEQDFLFFIDK